MFIGNFIVNINIVFPGGRQYVPPAAPNFILMQHNQQYSHGCTVSLVLASAPGNCVALLRPLFNSVTCMPLMPIYRRGFSGSQGQKTVFLNKWLDFCLMGCVRHGTAQVSPPWKGPQGLTVCIFYTNLVLNYNTSSLPCIPNALISLLRVSLQIASLVRWGGKKAHLPVPLVSAFLPFPQWAAPYSGPRNVLQSGKQVDVGQDPNL